MLLKLTPLLSANSLEEGEPRLFLNISVDVLLTYFVSIEGRGVDLQQASSKVVDA